MFVALAERLTPSDHAVGHTWVGPGRTSVGHIAVGHSWVGPGRSSAARIEAARIEVGHIAAARELGWVARIADLVVLVRIVAGHTVAGQIEPGHTVVDSGRTVPNLVNGQKADKP